MSWGPRARRPASAGRRRLSPLRRSAGVATLVALLAVLPHTGASQGRDAQVLLIGNSLTSANDLPGMIEALAASAGLTVRCTTVTFPNFGLEEHWAQGEALRMVRRGGWTHVVLQQGPTSLAESRRILIEYAHKFAPEIRAQRSAIVFYGVWPPANHPQAFDAVTASYAAAAADVGGTLVPVGKGWRLASQADPTLALYGEDGFHPSPAGSYLAGLMLAEAVAGINVEGLPPPSQLRHAALRRLRLSSSQDATLRSAAAAAALAR